MRAHGEPAVGGPFPVKLVLFPTVGNRAETVLQPVAASDAAMMCLGLGLSAKNPIAIFRDRLAYDRQLEIYTTLAESARCYRAVLGRDPEGVVSAVKAEFDRVRA
ncbi:MAG: hypothetical protein JO102_05310 [Elusimicrobia bacterium]|nr:hypothetical protein [Elusimicrobiota bacterium]